MAMKAEKGRVSIMTKQQKKTLNLVLTYLVIILIGCVLLFPIAWMISAAFKTNDEIFGSIALLPKSFSFQNFIDGWKSAGIYTYATYFINSFIMVIPTTLLTIASSALCIFSEGYPVYFPLSDSAAKEKDALICDRALHE